MAYHDTDMEPNLVKDAFMGWRQDPMTIKAFKRLEAKITEIEDNLGSGGTLDHESASVTLANTAREVGRIEGIREIFNLAIE